MLKKERHLKIQQLINEQNITTVNEIAKALDVSDMTIRRDFTELEDSGLIERVHGGAISKSPQVRKELSHDAKKILNKERKEIVTNQCLDLIEDNDVIYLGPGTTLELLASKITNQNILCVTNCFKVFQQLLNNDVEALLLGGRMREKTQSFVGDITIKNLKSFSFHKAFVSCNGVKENFAMTSAISEGATQEEALNNSDEKFLLIDLTKIGVKDFYKFYKLSDFTNIIIDEDDGSIELFVDDATNFLF
ncbi:DeoR/GlpR transcriptional regulator [Aerococcaceae bacterium DSM 111020]|nr:DeoR/GlpR transcriptional regulator [Aerococcaceae bacterium DSM 111020]